MRIAFYSKPPDISQTKYIKKNKNCLKMLEVYRWKRRATIFIPLFFPTPLGADLINMYGGEMNGRQRWIRYHGNQTSFASMQITGARQLAWRRLCFSYERKVPGRSQNGKIPEFRNFAPERGEVFASLANVASDILISKMAPGSFA